MDYSAWILHGHFIPSYLKQTSLDKPTTAHRCHLETEEFILEDLFRSVSHNLQNIAPLKMCSLIV